MSDRKVLCRGDSGTEVWFDYDFDPFFLYSLEGATRVQNNVITSENNVIDGSTYQGSTTRERNIVITGQMRENYRENREWLYKAFRPKSKGTLKFFENGETRVTEYYVEEIEIDDSGVVRNIVISLICPGAFFWAESDIHVDMASWEPLLEFDEEDGHEFLEEGEEFGRFVAEQIKEIPHDSETDFTGMTITFRADDTVKNPALYHMEQDEFIRVNITMRAGDTITVTTQSKNKHAWLVRGGVKTKINGDLDEDSEYIQLVNGENTLRYDADEGLDYLTVSIEYRELFLGV